MLRYVSTYNAMKLIRLPNAYLHVYNVDEFGIILVEYQTISMFDLQFLESNYYVVTSLFREWPRPVLLKQMPDTTTKSLGFPVWDPRVSFLAP